MPTLYVTEPGARLEKEYSRLLVVKDDEVLFRTPISRVDQVVLVGRAGATTDALLALLEHGTPLLLITRSGQLSGRLLPAVSPNLPLRRKQYERNADGRFGLQVARAIVEAKIHNQRTLALRLARRNEAGDGAAALGQLAAAKQSAPAAAGLAELLGIEGSAAQAYFRLFRGALRPPWDFPGRKRRPPTDPVNALLSLGYSLLSQSLMSALELVGLDPYLGYYHTEKYGRPALALDLVEEFRAPLVDSLTLDILNHHVVAEKDFETDPADGGVVLTSRGLRRYLRKYSERLESEFKSRELGRVISYRKLFEVQARRMARAVMDDATPYRPLRAR